MEQEVVFRLSLVRLRHQLSQRALAKRAAVAHATISLIESGRTSPSVSALKRILAGIPMMLAEFLSDELPPAESNICYRASQRARGGVVHACHAGSGRITGPATLGLRTAPRPSLPRNP